MSQEVADRRVKAGAALLDERMPGWAERIELAQLDLSSEWKCVLGQLFEESQTVYLPGLGEVCEANFHLGKVVLDLDDDAIILYGFDTGYLDESFDDEGELISEDFAHFRELDRAWEAEVRYRQPMAD
jgi:hypothetical protein